MSLIDRIELWLKLTEKSRAYSANTFRQVLPYILVTILLSALVGWIILIIFKAAKRWDDKRKQRKRNENAPDL